MKNMKKFASLLLVVIMMLAMAIPAMAAMEGTLTGGSITIKDAIEEQVYSAYQILYLESYNETSKAYAYKANSAWKTWLKEQTAYVSFDNQDYVTWVEGADVVAFAKAAQTQLENKTADSYAKAESAIVTLDNLNLGYYLVDTTLGTLCSLDTTNPDVEMEEKNEAPTIIKEVKEDSTGEWGETNDADINQVVEYKATITVQKGAENYIMHDTMSEGLTYTGVTAVKIGNVDVDAANYTVTTLETCPCTFEVKFDNTYIASLAAGTEIAVYYSATLNEEAVVGLPGNPNEVKLQYGDENKPSFTPVDQTITYTWDMKVIKYTTETVKGEEGAEDTVKEVLLAGATFKLSTDEAGTNILKFHNLGNNEYEYCAKTDCTKEHVSEITTDATGTFHIEGLDADTYYLTETAAPAGYNKLAASIKVEITAATKGDDGKLSYTTVEQKVENNSGTELPSTGGMGTTLFYIAGAILVVGAVVVMISKKRSSEK